MSRLRIEKSGTDVVVKMYFGGLLGGRVKPRVQKPKRLNFKLDINLKEFVLEQGTPLVLVSEEVLKRRFNKLREALNKHYSNSDVGYSFKTNNIVGVCKLFKKLGAKAEVVSGYEYYLAKKIGYRGDEIIFNGPYKKKNELENALGERCVVNVNDKDELEIVLAIAKASGLSIDIGTRLNSDVWESHFGFNIESGEALDVCRRIKKAPNINLAGLHMHAGYNLDSPLVYKRKAEIMSSFARLIKAEESINVSYLNLGGGFPAGSKPHGKDKWKLPGISKYVKEIAVVVSQNCDSRSLKILLEPGRYLVDDAVALVAQVVSSNVSVNKQYITVNTSIDHIPLVTYREQEVALGTELGKGKLYTSFIYGVTCRENDVLVRDIRIRKVKVGDLLTFIKIGAYNISWQNQFCFPRPPVFMVYGDSRVKQVRRGETFDDMVIRDIF